MTEDDSVELPQLFQSDQAQRLIEQISELGFAAEECSGHLVARRSTASASPAVRRNMMIPLAELDGLERQLADHPKELADWFGFVTESGFFELIVRTARGPIDIFLSRLESESDDGCPHKESQPMPTLAYPERYVRAPYGDQDRQNKPIHLFDPDTGTCIEVSWASPCGLLFGPPNLSSQFRPRMSIKVYFNHVMNAGEIEDRAIQITNAFLYELAVRNGLVLEPIGLATFERYPVGSRRRRTNQVRFPRTRVDHEVAELFGFAESARDNPPLAFLSFYQVLEYYFPYAVRRVTLKRIKKELVDPRFLRSESDLLRIISIAESGAQASESSQIATLLSESVREDRLAEFFADEAVRKHFHKTGPISGMESITSENRTKSLTQQVAERVYKIRNRIVHAKDDPKFSEVRVLLPRSREAASLGPDIDLMRLLAVEVITDAQLNTISGS
jgi:hypothetical protein